ncbi:MULTISPECIES: DUF3108 domain-containing protein [Moraxella]|uniref:DUF3108 domain-containing protein n=2 Tax=Moraxella TaxID=475 RepID=A0A1B8Q468_MORLA|nr:MULTISPECIES: DUF3108 domain-containing protein [Moraxella]MBE9579326.1 DUF3108 domain-containing protein [Moraxella sp. K1664]MBE9588687.1 DUF3108 domain-containing protein [Moraxella sp. K1630]MBE9596902.1 DUF3108 domain-containing protein [Moraxella sp. K2450]MDH9219421.1 DUF3108 domain-containing protein [Moraxella lacunata]MDI4483388.1 DUF3108 domain-containing protein [Moraxella lacunata]
MTIFKNFLKTTTITTAILAGATLSANASDLSGFSATYVLKADDKKGTATRTLIKNGDDYHYHVKASAAGVASVNQSASFSLSNGRIVPSSSNMSVRVLGVGRTHNIKFNNSAKSVVSTYKGKSTTLRMNGQAYDDLSLETQIRQELINGKFSGNYHLVKKNEIEATRFRRSGSSKITVPAGTYDAIRIDRVHDDKGRATSFWLAPSLNYLPVKVSQTNDGKVISMELTKVN